MFNKIKMIPRSRVNYTFFDLFNLSFIKPKEYYSQQVLLFLKNLFSQKNILLTPSGRGGLYFILKSLPQKNVLIPAYTCNAVVEAINHAGKNCCYIEVEEKGFNVNINLLKEKLLPDSIFIATHQFGFPTEIKEIKEICDKNNCILIEDCAGSFGTRILNKLTGTFGDFAFFSFDSTKLINAPLKAGFVIVRNDINFRNLKEIYYKEIQTMPFLHKVELFIKALIYTLISSSNLIYKLFHFVFFKLRNIITSEIANINLQLSEFYKYDVTNWQSAIILKQLNNLDDIISKRQNLYNFYQQKLKNSMIKLPPHSSDNSWVCIRFPVMIENKIEFYHKLVKNNIDSAFSFTYIVTPKKYRLAHKYAEHILDIPFYYRLSYKEQNYIINKLNKL
jgi:dTDP-4-amino-4,6-dideoxygalactose transaminase